MAIRKELLHRRGAVADLSVRPPGPGLDPSTRAALDRMLGWIRPEQGGTWIPANVQRESTQEQ